MQAMLGPRQGLLLSQRRPALIKPCVRSLVVVASKNFGGKGGSKSGGGGGGDVNPVSKFLSDMKGKLDGMFSQSGKGSGWAQGAADGGGRGGPGGRGGAGDDEGKGGWGEEEEPSETPETSFWDDFVGTVKMVWVVFWNLALFLAVADVMHRSLAWFAEVELLMLVGAPQQALERLGGRVFAVVEWVEANFLGWDIPKDTDMIPKYENLKRFTPEETAYTFDAYRYGAEMTAAEKQTLKYAYALKHYERDGGRPGDVDPQDAQNIIDKYDPMEADRMKYRTAQLQGNLDEYWAEQAAGKEKFFADINARRAKYEAERAAQYKGKTPK